MSRTLNLLALPGARFAVTLAALPTLVGCYSMHPAPDVAALPTGRRVELVLTPEGAGALAERIGPQAARIYGELVRTSPDTVHLALVRTVRQDGQEWSWQGEQVAVARRLVAASTERRLDRKRSWLVAGAIVVGAALFAGFGRGRSGGSGDLPIVTPPN